MTKYIVGLGNPDNNLVKTRHNLGYMVLDYLVLVLAKNKEWQESKKGKLKYLWTSFKKTELELVKPLTYMNSSGLAVKYLKKKHPQMNSGDLYVIHDDMDIEMGKYKIQFAKGPKLHGGINSIEKLLKSKEFWRIRIGIGSVNNGGKEYVLDRFSQLEQTIINGVIKQAAEELLEKINASQ